MENQKDGLLAQIQYPVDLRKLSVEQLPQVCQELREDIVKELSVNPGHLASSLGVAEITVALHYVYNTPEDRIVWDVGHQAYGHKILTGRREQFCTNRKLGGIRPFPSPFESEYDTFACGHASNSISAALGMAVAAKLEKQEGRHVVAVIGDGALSGGLAFEGLNNVSSSPNDLLIILNDNDMSIDRSVGGMQKYLLGLNTHRTYNAIKFKATRWLHNKGLLNDDRKKGIQRLSNAIKSAIAHQQNIFDGMNIRPSCCTCTRRRDTAMHQPKRMLRHGMHQASSIPIRASASWTMTRQSHRSIRTCLDTHYWSWHARTRRLWV